MTEDLKNPLDPTLTLILNDDTPGQYVYSLEIQVTDRCIDARSKTVEPLIEKPKEGFLDLNLAFQLLDPAATCESNVEIAELTDNPEGLPGNITVLIKDNATARQQPPLDGDGHGPQSDGKTIIRFQDAIHR